MKRHLFLSMLICGSFAAGWRLPSWRHDSRETPERTAVTHDIPRRNRARETRKKQLLEQICDDNSVRIYKVRSATSLSVLLAAMRETSMHYDEDIARVVDMDPAAALGQWLSDPAASAGACEKIAAAWARRDPEQAIRYLEGNPSYRAQDCLYAALAVSPHHEEAIRYLQGKTGSRAQACLYQVLVGAYQGNPKLVGEVIHTQPREWQMQHLEDFFSRTYRVREPGAPPETKSDDPFFDDGHWITKRYGEEILDSLADDGLRAQARECWEEKKPDADTASGTRDKPLEPLDVANLKPDVFGTCELLREHLAKDREATIAAVAESGSYELRAKAIWYLMAGFPMDEKSWPKAFAEVEDWMDRLGVIPEYPPSHFEMGPFLRGKETAAWIDRQPPGLQRAWAPTFTETWAGFEPEDAINWARALPEAAVRDESVQSGMIVWAHEKPLEASAYVEGLPAGDMRESAISNTAAAWACVDHAGAVAWLNSLPESPGKARARERVK